MEIPTRYRNIIEPLIAAARERLEDGKSLDPIAVVGNVSTNQGISVRISIGDDESKEQSARAIQTAAAQINADFIFTVMEAWGLPKDKPYEVDAVSFALETRHGIWATQLPIMPKDPAKRTRTFGEVTLKFVNSAQGLAGLLPLTGEATSHGSWLH